MKKYRLDLQQQRVERAVSAELAKTAEVITKTGLFDNIDKLYGKKESEPAGESGADAGAGGDMGGMPDMGGGSEPPPPRSPSWR